MASDSKMWFELGVRDNVTKVLESLIGKTSRLQQALTAVDKDLGFKNAYKNAADMESALNKVGVALKKVNAAKLDITDKNKVAELDKVEKKLKVMQRELKAFFRDLKKEPNVVDGGLNVKGIVDTFTKKLGVDLAVKQVNDLLRENVTEQNKAAQAARNNAMANQGLVTAYDKVVNASKNVNSLTSQIGRQIASTFSIYAIEGLLKNIIQIGGEFEVQHIALQNILGDIQQANTLFAQLKSLAVESPFSFKKEVTYSKQLAAFNIPYKEIFETTKRLGDMSAGLGVDMSRLILAYGQVRSAAVLRGQELRQFTEAGIPLVQALADEFTRLNGKLVTTGEVFSLISKRAVPFEMVKKILWDMTDDGGRFYNMQFNLADTLAGKWSNLRDAWEIMLSDFAKGSSTGGTALKYLVSLTTELIKGMNALSPLIWGVMSGLMATKGIKAAQNAWHVGLDTMKKNVVEAQKLNAIEIQRKFALKEITDKERDELLLQNANIRNSMNQLVITGRMSATQMYRALRENQISREYVAQAHMLGIINDEEYRAIMTGNARLMLQERIKKSMNTGWAFWVGVAVMAGTAIYQAYSQWSDAIDQQVDAVVQGAKNKSKELEKIIEQNKKVPEEREDLRSRVNQMREVLENSDAYTTTIDEQVKRAKDLREQYDILLKAIKETKEQADFTANNKNNIANAIKATSTKFSFGGGSIGSNLMLTAGLNLQNFGSSLYDFFFNDDINKNLKQYDEQLTAYKNQQRAIMAYRDDYVKAINDMKSESEGFAKLVKNLSPEEALVKIVNSQYWDEFKGKVSASGDAFIRMTDKLNGYYDGMSEHMNEIVKDDIPKIVEELARQEGISFAQYKENAKKYPEYTKQMITGIVSSLNEGSAAARGELAKALLEFFGLASDAASTQKVVDDSKIKPYRDQTTQGRYILGKLTKGAKEKGWGDNNGNGIWDVKWINKFFGDGTGYVAGIQAMQQAYNTMKEEVAATKAAGAKLNAKDELEWSRLQKAAQILDLKDKRSKLFNSDSNKKDEQLKAWKERKQALDEYYKLYKEFSQYMSKDEAINRINATGLIKGQAMPDNIDDYLSVMEAFMNEIKGDVNSTDRQSFWNNLVADYNKKDFEQNSKKTVEAMLKQLEKSLKEEGKKWDLYKKILDATGSKEKASNIAFGGGVRFDNFAQELRDKINKELEKFPNAKNEGIDKLLGLNAEELENLGVYGKSELIPMLKELADVEQQLKAEDVELFIEALKNAKSLDTELDQIKVKYDRIRESIRNNANLSTEEKNTLISNADRNESEARANKVWEYFKKDEEWGRVFGNLNRMSTNTLRNMKEKLEEVAPSINDSVEATKALYEAIEKINGVLGERNPFENISNALSKHKSIKELLNSIKDSADNDEVYISKATSKKTGIKAGKRTAGEVRKEGKDEDRSSGEDFVKGLQGVSTGFDTLMKATQPLIDIFNTLGMTDLGKVLGGVQSAMGGAVSGGLAGIMIGGAAAGPWGAAIGAGLSIMSSVLGSVLSGNEESIKEEIDASKALKTEMENLSKNIEKILERSLGGVYTYSNPANKSQFNEQIKNFLKQRWANDSPYNRNGRTLDSYMTTQEATAVNKARQSGEYFDQQYALLLMQKHQVEDMLKGEQDLKDPDKGNIASYKQQIAELNDQIQNFATDMAKALYDIDVKSWAQEFSDALVTAWENGEDAAEAYSKSVKTVMKKLAKSILQEKVMAAAFKNAGIEELIANIMTSRSGKLTYEDVVTLSNAIMRAGEQTDEVYTAILDELYKRGVIDKEGSNGGLSSTIKGVTESTADLLASYINAIRLDVSVNRGMIAQYYPQFLNGISQGNIIANAQLTQLQMIASSTSKNAEIARDIYDILHASQNGSKALRTKS